jgi:hypothetical protein
MTQVPIDNQPFQARFCTNAQRFEESLESLVQALEMLPGQKKAFLMQSVFDSQMQIGYSQRTLLGQIESQIDETDVMIYQGPNGCLH